MVAIVENYASVVATVLAVEPAAGDEARNLVTLHVDSLSNHQHFPNLVRLLPANRLRVFIKRKVSASLELAKGTKLSAIVRAAGGDCYYFKEDSIKVA